MILYRPVGMQELELIYDSGMKAFPARLPQQPIFYPVLNLEYARQIASDWNAKSGQQAGYVTQFKVEDEYIARFEKHTVGGSQHQEFWIPAEELEEFNRHITGTIKVVEAHFGESFDGFIPDQFGLQGKNAIAQFTLLANTFVYKRLEFYQELKRNHKAVFLNYPFWLTHEFKNQGLKEKVLQGIKEAWLTSFPMTPLPSPVPLEVKPVEQSDTDPLDDPDSEETTPDEQEESTSWEDDVREEEIRKKLSSVSASVKPLREEPKPEEPVEPPKVPVKPVQQAAPHPRAPSSYSLAKPAQQEARQPESHFKRGVKLGLEEKYREAVDELSKAVEENPRHIVVRTSLGVACHRLGEDDRALSSYGTALKIDPRYAEAHYFRANILYGRGEVREAIKGFTTAIGLKPELIDAHEGPRPQDRLTDYTDLPSGMNRIVRPARQILELNHLIEANPQQAQLFKERAAEYSRLWNYEQAIADYSASLKIQPGDARVLHLRGQAYEQIGQAARALEDYKQAISLDPQLSEVYFQRGVELGKMGNYRQSIDSLTEGIQLAPGNPNGYFNRGTSYFQIGDLESAIDDFSMVIQLSSKDEDAYYWRGVSYEEAGRSSEAIADYKQFLAISENPEAREEVEYRLRQWKEENPKERSRGAVSDARQKTNQLEQVENDRDLDLYDLVAVLGDRALQSTWFASDVDCKGVKADELSEFADRNQPISGRDLLEITSSIRQTVKGDFQAFDSGAETPWLFVRAWKGEGFYVETNDVKVKERLKSQIPSLEEVEGVPAPYMGLFIRI